MIKKLLIGVLILVVPLIFLGYSLIKTATFSDPIKENGSFLDRVLSGGNITEALLLLGIAILILLGREFLASRKNRE